MIDHGGSFSISDQSLSLVLLLLLLPLRGSGGGGVLGLKEESGQIMDGLPNEHRERLEFLTTVLAMDKEWSAVRSEKIKIAFASEINLEKHFCPSLLDFKNKTLDSIEISKQIMKNCPYSGMHVQFAAESVAMSVQCLFYRHAQLQLDVITIGLSPNEIEEFVFHLKRLVDDYQMIANRLASMDVDLHILIKLVRYFDEVERNWVTSKENNQYYKDIKKKAKKLKKNLNDLNMTYCAVSSNIWYGQDNYKVKLSMKDIEPEFKKNTNEANIPPIVKKAQKLRLILLEEFEKLRLGILPPEVWKDVFENNILVRQIERKVEEKTAKSNKSSGRRKSIK